MPHIFLTLQKDSNYWVWQERIQEFLIGGGGTIVAIFQQIYIKVGRRGVGALQSVYPDF